jgi:hypothetical protein
MSIPDTARRRLRAAAILLLKVLGFSLLVVVAIPFLVWGLMLQVMIRGIAIAWVLKCVLTNRPMRIHEYCDHHDHP